MFVLHLNVRFIFNINVGALTFCLEVISDISFHFLKSTTDNILFALSTFFVHLPTTVVSKTVSITYRSNTVVSTLKA